MNLTVNVPELPPGWVFDSIWRDSFEKDESRIWSITAAYRHGERTILSVDAYGSNPQEAADRIVHLIAETVAFITNTKDWVSAKGINPVAPDKYPDGVHTY